jgi:hypothetical protein
MPKRIDRREFLSVTAGAGLSLPALLPAKVGEKHRAISSTENRVNGANSPSTGETGKSVVFEEIRASAAEVQRWDYVKHPVRVSGNLPRAENVNPSDPILVLTEDAGSTFDPEFVS